MIITFDLNFAKKNDKRYVLKPKMLHLTIDSDCLVGVFMEFVLNIRPNNG